MIVTTMLYQWVALKAINLIRVASLVSAQGWILNKLPGVKICTTFDLQMTNDHKLRYQVVVVAVAQTDVRPIKNLK